MKIWTLAHGVWLERNKARHGATSEEQADKKKERLLAEVELWYSHKENGELALDEEEERIFHPNFAEHEEKEGTLSKVKMWLNTFGSLLQNRLSDMMMKRKREKKNKNKKRYKQDRTSANRSASTLIEDY